MASQKENSPIVDSPPLAGVTDEKVEPQASDKKKGCIYDGVEYGDGGVACIGGITHMCVAGRWHRMGGRC